jgi:hypothetical protein
MTLFFNSNCSMSFRNVNSTIKVIDGKDLHGTSDRRPTPELTGRGMKHSVVTEANDDENDSIRAPVE